MRAPSLDGFQRWATGPGLAVAAVACLKLVVHLHAGRHFGYFVDELYHLACADHLAWGYVDQPPLIAVIAKASVVLFGDSLLAVRLFAILAGVAEVLLAGLLARELGGGRFAQGLASLCVLVAPGILTSHNWLSMNAFEPLFWMGCAFLAIRIVRTGDQRLWLWFGVLAGLGLENKYSMLIFGFGLVAGLALTPERRLFRSRWFWIAGLIAFAIFLPNLLWNVQHGFPFLTVQRTLMDSPWNAPMSPPGFLAQVFVAMMPLAAPVWLVGLWSLFFSPGLKQFRALGWAFLITAAVIMALNPRPYYLYPAFPLLFAAGAVAWERWIAAPRPQWVKAACAVLLLIAGAAAAPLAIPILPVGATLRYAAALHYRQPHSVRVGDSALPRFFGHQFGWEEMVAAVARVYNRLPADVRPGTAIFCRNYGQAGAVDLLGARYGLPKSIGGHQNYFLWGPRSYTGQSMIVVGVRRESLENRFAAVEKMARVEHPYSSSWERADIFYCRGLNQPLKDAWPEIRKWR